MKVTVYKTDKITSHLHGLFDLLNVTLPSLAVLRQLPTSLSVLFPSGLSAFILQRIWLRRSSCSVYDSWFLFVTVGILGVFFGEDGSS